MKVYCLSFLFFLAACSSLPATNFFRDSEGKFSLNGTGAEFFALQIPGSTIATGTVFDVNNIGEWTYNGYTYFSPEEAQSPGRAVYRFNQNNTYFAVLFDAKRTFMVSTNTVSRPEDVDFSFLVPIAVKQ